MSVNLDQLPPLVEIYANAKRQTVPNNQAIWNGIQSISGGVVVKTLAANVGDISNVVADTNATVKANIEAGVSATTNVTADIFDDIKQWFIDRWNELTGTVTGIVNGISTAVNDLKNKIGTVVNDVIGGVTKAFNDVIGDIGDAIETAIGWIRDKIQGVIDAVSNIGNQIGQWITNAINNISDWISNGIQDAIASAAAFVAGVIDTVKGWIEGIYNSVKDWIVTAYNNVKDWVVNAYNTVKNAIEQTVKNISDTYESVKATVVDWIAKAILWVNTAKDNLVAFFWRTVTNIGAWFAQNVMPKFENAVEGAQAIYKLMGLVWDAISSGDYNKAFGLLDGFVSGLGLPAPVQTIHAILSTIAYFWQTVHLQFVPAEVAATKKAQIALQLEPISTTEAAQGVYRGLWNEASFTNNLYLAGVSKEKAKISLEANRPLPTPGQTQQLFLRGAIDEKDHDFILASYGFSEEHIKEIKALYQIIPPVADIITMAVKEAFSPDIVAKFGQDQDLPAAFVSWAKKQGLTEDWAGRYWAAHWDLPSPQMGFTMYQRGIVDKDTLKLLLRALDIMPFWREKLIELSYNPPTRVDVRRMYKMGVITEDQVYKFHLDIGYSPENARLLTDFTKRYSAPEDESEQDKFTDLARSTYSAAYKDHIISEDEYREFMRGLKYVDQDIDLLVSIDDYAIMQKDNLFDYNTYRKGQDKLIQSGYNRGLLNRTDAATMLIDLGYNEDQAELILESIDYNRELAKRDVIVQSLHDQYVGYIIDTVDLHTTMDSLGFYANEVDRLQEDWDIERSFRTKRPTIADLKSFYNKGLITIEQLLDELRGMGYHEKYIDLYSQTLAK